MKNADSLCRPTQAFVCILLCGLSIISSPLPTATANAATAKTQNASMESIKKGQALAKKLCSRCHNIQKSGESPNKLAPPFRTFASKWPLQDLEEALAEGIVVGHSVMPEFELDTNDISNLLDFLASIAEKK